MPVKTMENSQGLLLKKISSFLQKNNIAYMITGAWSVIFYGRPRASHDIDFVIEINKKDLGKITDSFRKLPKEFLVQPEQISTAFSITGIFNILHLPTALKLDFWVLKNDAFDKTRFFRRLKKRILNQDMYLASAEDTILKKLLWYKEAKIEKHLIDAAFVYQIQKDNLDKRYLTSWVKKHKTTKLLKEISLIDLEEYY